MALNENKIFIIQADSFDEMNSTANFKVIGDLVGHTSGVSFVSWSKQSDHKLVSASFDNTVRVWNTQTMECIAWSEYENRMNCAIFMPTGEKC